MCAISLASSVAQSQDAIRQSLLLPLFRGLLSKLDHQSPLKWSGADDGVRLHLPFPGQTIEASIWMSLQLVTTALK